MAGQQPRSSPRRTLPRRCVLGGFTASLGLAGLAGCTDALTGRGSGDSSDDHAHDDHDADDHDDHDGPSDDESDDESNESSEGNDGADEGSETEVHEEYETTGVRVTTPDGDELGEVTAAIADTPELQQLGLSDTDELPEDRGMLFVYEEVDDRVFAMPEMSFGIDIVYADDEGVITGIHHAPEPEPDEDGSEHHYPGRGQYVLEVVYEWTAERDVEEGDVLEFDL